MRVKWLQRDNIQVDDDTEGGHPVVETTWPQDTNSPAQWALLINQLKYRSGLHLEYLIRTWI